MSTFCSELKILVVEDDITNQLLIVKLLNKINYTCDLVCDGRAAVDAILSQQYDIIFMDLHMPVMDGFEATRLILNRQHGLLRPYILAHSSTDDLSEIEKCFEVGMKEFVSKPLSLKALQTILDKYKNLRKIEKSFNTYFLQKLFESSDMGFQIQTRLLHQIQAQAKKNDVASVFALISEAKFVDEQYLRACFEMFKTGTLEIDWLKNLIDEVARNVSDLINRKRFRWE